MTPNLLVRLSAIVALLVIVSAGGCASQSADTVDSRRIADLEAKVAALEKFAAAFPGPSVLELQEHTRTTEKRIDRLEDTSDHNHSVYECVERLQVRAGNLEKKCCVKRPDWWCCGQRREGEPSVDPEWIGLIPFKPKDNDIEAPAPPNTVEIAPGLYRGDVSDLSADVRAGLEESRKNDP